MPRLTLLTALLPLAVCVPASAQTSAYVINENSGSMSVVETQSDTVSATIRVGERPRGLVTAGGERLYVSREDGTLIERDMYARVESGGAKLGRVPRSIDLSPDYRFLAAAVQGSAEDEAGIVVVDLAMMRIAKTIPLRSGRRPANAVYSPDGRWIYASAEDGSAVDVIDVERNAVTRSIAVGSGLRGITFLPDGSRAYVAVERDAEVVVIDVARQTVLAREKAATAPGGLIAHPDGKRVFVSSAGLGRIQVLDTADNKFVASFEGCSGTSSMALTPDGKKLYVSCGSANELSVIDASTYKRLAQIPVGDKPGKVVVSLPPLPPDGGEPPPRPGRRRSS